MSQFPGGQPGFQYAMATGYPSQAGQFGAPPPQQQQQQQFGQPTGQLQFQQTGFVPQQQQQFMTGIPPQATGFAPMRAQATGFVGGAPGGFGRGGPMPPVPPVPQQFQAQQQFRPAPPPPPTQSGFLGASTPSYLSNQQTGYGGAGTGMMSVPAPLVPQATGFIDPRLTLMANTLIPSGPPIPSGMSLQQSFNQTSQNRGQPQMSWTITRAEKKKYDQIFRAWDPQGTGFISGTTAAEVFKESQLEKNDLANVWRLADTDNRGKLNIAEFHVAMGLIYRKLNGVNIPDELPQEMIPPSARDADEAVNFLKGILEKDSHTRSTNSSVEPGGRVSYAPTRSLHTPQGAGNNSKDGTLYTHTTEKSYKSSIRHINRDDVRTGEEDAEDDIQDLKRQLENSKSDLDRASAANASRSREDEALDREMDDLKSRVRRVRDEIDYVSRGPRSDAREEDRRRLEREMLQLTHERIPEVERKIDDRNRRRERERREWSSKRDYRNDTSGRYDSGRSSPGMRGTFDRDEYRNRDFDRDRDRDRDRDEYRSRDAGRDREYDRDRDRDYRRDDRDRDRDSGRDRDRDFDRRRDDDRDRDRDRPRTPQVEPPADRSRTPLTVPPSRGPTASPAPPSGKTMTPEEKQAFIRAEAQRRTQERMRKLGLSVPSTASPDISVEDRLATERKEAEEKSRKAEEEAELREKKRQERLLEARGGTPGPEPKTTPAAVPAAPPPAPVRAAAPPAPVRAAAAAAAPTLASTKKSPAPPPPKKRPPPPAKPVSAAFVPPVAAVPPPAPPPAPVEPQEDPEEKRLRERQEAMRRRREALEAEEREFEERQSKLRQQREAASAASTPVVSTPVMSPPVATPPVGTPSTAAKTNPFHRLGGPPAASPAASTGVPSTNPFFRPNNAAAAPPPAAEVAARPSTAAPEPPAPPPPPPAPSVQFTAPRSVSVPITSPPPSQGVYNRAPKKEEDHEWGSEPDDSDSSDDEMSGANHRNKLAAALFGTILPSTPSRPTSTAPEHSASAGLSPTSAAPPFAPPPPPPPPPVASQPAPTFAADGGAPPPPPPPPPVIGGGAPVAKPGGINALLGDIQSGLRLRKTVTNDRSIAPTSGRVVGDAAPPAHVGRGLPSPPAEPVSLPPPPAAPVFEPPPSSATDTNEDEQFYTPPASRSDNRQSVDWYGDLAAHSIGRAPEIDRMPSMAELDEEPAAALPTAHANGNGVPDIRVDDEAEDPLADIDKAIHHRAYSLYPYDAQRTEELSFAHNTVLEVNPSKSGSEWWFGKNLATGGAGLLPKTYIDLIEAGSTISARAVYDYTAQNADELSLQEGDTLTVLDRADPDWWKVESKGVVRVVPALYVEAIQS